MSLRAHPSSELDIAAAANTLRGFFAAQPRVEVREAGETLLTVGGEHSGFEINSERGRLVLHLWSPERSLVRRVVALDPHGGSLRLACLRFGQSQPTPLVLAGEDAGATGVEGQRTRFRQFLLATLRREWPAYRPDRPARDAAPEDTPMQRVLLRRGSQYIACLGVAEDEPQAVCEAALGAAILWAEDLRGNVVACCTVCG